MDYHILRQIADSWVLLAMFGFFVGAILWVYRPGSRASHADAGQVPFRHEDRPLTEAEARNEAATTGNANNGKTGT